MIICRDCGSWWKDRSWTHCSGCHDTFTDDDSFSAHRIHGKCWGYTDLPLGLDRLSRAGWMRLKDGAWSLTATPRGVKE